MAESRAADSTLCVNMSVPDMPVGLKFYSTELRQRQADPTWRFSRGQIDHIHGWLVSAVDSKGRRGCGHVLTTPIGAPDVAKTAAALAEGVSALDVLNTVELERAHQMLAEACPTAPTVRSGLLSALSELQAVQWGVPLHRLFGGAIHASLPAVRLVPIKPAPDMAAAAAALRSEGYNIIKLKLSGELDLDIERVRAVRRQLGPSVRLTVDANQAYDADAAMEMCKAMAALSVSLVEQPVRADDWDAIARITRAGLVPIEADESIGGSLKQLVQLIAMGAANSYNVKIPYFGGLRDAWVAAQVCQAAGVGCRLGAIFGPRLASAQAAHLASVLPVSDLGVELAESEHILDDPFTGFDVHDGTITVPQAVGSGVSLGTIA